MLGLFWNWRGNFLFPSRRNSKPHQLVAELAERAGMDNFKVKAESTIFTGMRGMQPLMVSFARDRFMTTTPRHFKGKNIPGEFRDFIEEIDSKLENFQVSLYYDEDDDTTSILIFLPVNLEYATPERVRLSVNSLFDLAVKLDKTFGEMGVF